MLDLRRAYLQVFVEPALQMYQAVKYNGKTYLMTRMAFGLSVAPKIMTAIVSKILGLDEKVCIGTDSYIDDILVDEDIINAEHVMAHLKRYGLQTKPVERMGKDGIRVLGLRVYEDETGKLMWKRDCCIPVAENTVLTRRQVFSICGRLVGHFPVASWLRVACNFLKRQTGQLPWDEVVAPQVSGQIHQLLRKVAVKDPVGGVWNVSDTTNGEVWVDASGLAYGACVKIDDTIVEDASWLRPIDDAMHINVAELDAAIKGVNMALRWNLKKIALYTDSHTCAGWLRATINKQRKIHTRGMADMLVRRRLSVLSELIDSYKLAITVHQVSSGRNCADALTRVERAWWKNMDACIAVAQDEWTLRESHNRHHFGVDKTMELLDPAIPASRASVAKVVESCVPCQTVDPTVRKRWKRGGLAVNKLWFRVAIDVTHFRGQPFLTAIDCCSRYAVWKRLRNEDAASVVFALEDLFASFGPPSELLSDNAPVFSSDPVTKLLADWDVCPILSAAYRPQGNGLIERNHRTIKRSAERSGRTIHQIVALYNNTTHSTTGTVPYELLFSARSKIAGCRHQREDLATRPNLRTVRNTSSSTVDNPFLVGDEVYVKPPNPRCTTRWQGPFRVSEVIDGAKVRLDGLSGIRHVSHLRQHIRIAENVDEETTDESQDEAAMDSLSDSDNSGNETVLLSPRRSTRNRRPVDRLHYNVLGGGH